MSPPKGNQDMVFFDSLSFLKESEKYLEKRITESANKEVSKARASGRPEKVFCSKRLRFYRENSMILKRKVKLKRAQGECLGTGSRRRTQQAAKSCGEPQAGNDPQISEWSNPPAVKSRYHILNT